VASPQLRYSTYLGGSAINYAEDQPYGIAVDAAGHAFVVGGTGSDNFPVTQQFGPGGFAWHAFMTKLSPAGDRIVYSALLPGATARAAAVDAQGFLYVIGETYSPDFPTTAGSAQPEYGGGALDAFVAKLSPDGSQLIYCTFLGGSDLELGKGIAIDGEGNAYVIGWTTSTNFPVNAQAAQRELGGNYDAFVAKLNSTGSALMYATYLGGASSESGTGISVDTAGRAIVTGHTLSPQFRDGPNPIRLGPGGNTDAYLARLNTTGTTIEWLTIIGGEAADQSAAIALDSAGQAFVFGQTRSKMFPATGNSLQPQKAGDDVYWDNFVFKLGADGQSLAYATYLGGTYSESLTDFQYVGAFYLDGELIPDLLLPSENGGIAVDAQGNAFVAGRTEPEDFHPARASNVAHGYVEGYWAKINPAGTELLSLSFVGGRDWDAARDIALGPSGNVFVIGATLRPQLTPLLATTPGAAQPTYRGNVSDGFVARFADSAFAPANDFFATRARILGNRLTVEANNTEATSEAGELPVANLASAKTLWWSWTAPGAGRVRLSTAPADFDTMLAVFRGQNLGELIVVDVSDDENAAENRLTSSLEFMAAPGVEYQIVVDGKGGASGTLSLSLIFSGQANDHFANRQMIPSFPASVSASNQDATFEAGEMWHGESPGGQSLWWSWTATQNANVAVSTSGSDFDTLLAVYTGTELGELALVKGNNNSSDAATTSQVTFKAIQGETYHIAVDGQYTATGQIQLHLLPGDPPANDNFADASILSGNLVEITASNVNATLEPGEPDLGFVSPSGNTVWWTWTAPAKGRVNVSTEGSSFNTRLGIYRGLTFETLSLVASSDDVDLANGKVFSAAVFQAEPGVRYSILVDGITYNHSGRVQLALRLTLPPQILVETMTLDGTGRGQFRVRGEAGSKYAVETSLDLRSWSRASEAQFEGESFLFEWQRNPGEAQRFFRVIELP
ncbi:MAG: SBBP repeat-containing protein, partial [Verrucomicrobiota bacterium]